MQFINFLWQNSSAAAAKNFNMAATIFIKQIFHVFEKLKVTALVRCYSNSLYIFFNCGFYNFIHTAIMTKMNNFCTFRLHDAPHNINCSIVPVEQSGGSDNSDFILQEIT